MAGSFIAPTLMRNLRRYHKGYQYWVLVPVAKQVDRMYSVLCFQKLRSAGTANHGSYYSIQEITSDEMVICAKGGDWYDGGILVDLHQHTYKPTHDMINNVEQYI